MSVKVIISPSQRFTHCKKKKKKKAHGQDILCCPAYIALLSHTSFYSGRIQILYTVVHPRVQVTIGHHKFESSHWSAWNSCLFFSTELFFPFGALWHFSMVSLARRAFGCSRFFSLLSCLCMLGAGSSDGYCGGSVSQRLTGWDRLVSGHRPHQLRSTGCVFISENKIPL